MATCQPGDQTACTRAGADALGQAAAALASISLVFKGIDASYSAALLANATELYRCTSDPSLAGNGSTYLKRAQQPGLACLLDPHSACPAARETPQNKHCIMYTEHGSPLGAPCSAAACGKSMQNPGS